MGVVARGTRGLFGEHGIADAGDAGPGAGNHQRFDDAERNPAVAPDPHLVVAGSRFGAGFVEQSGDLFECDDATAHVQGLVSGDRHHNSPGHLDPVVLGLADRRQIDRFG